EILSGVFNPLIAQLRNLPIPTVAAVHGPCLGVGFGLAMACDVVLAARKSTLGSPFANIGCVLDSGGHLALVHRVGAHRALELIYTAELINGERAEQIGLVNRVVDDDALIDTAREMVMSIANGPTQALLESKRIISGIIDDGSSLAEVLEAEAAAQGRMAGTPDYVEGISAFLEKRKPTFNGPA
ncbi:MAG: enoyl-CoA hydratase-related protein, partial [Actinomycetota bacterium]|nr:enoyl-CoA hydratase-related protein [Actinomycetota bacterium]